MQKEIFKDIPGYEGLYQIGDLGSVKSLNYRRTGKEKLLCTRLDGSGYPMIDLYRNGNAESRNVHQLVAIVFFGHKPNGIKMVVNHKNFIKTDNRVENIEIVTNRENSNRKHIKSSSKYVGVCWDKSNGKWVSRIQVNGKRKHLGVLENEDDAGVAYQSALSSL
jgi:hypothetical protein